MVRPLRTERSGPAGHRSGNPRTKYATAGSIRCSGAVASEISSERTIAEGRTARNRPLGQQCSQIGRSCIQDTRRVTA